MRNFLLGVVVGATGMGFYTGFIRVDVNDKIKKDVGNIKTQAEGSTEPTP